MNLIDKFKEQIVQMEKYQKWAHDKGLYSNIFIDVAQYGIDDIKSQYNFNFSCQPKSYTNVKAFMKEFSIKKMDKAPSFDKKELDFNTNQNNIKIKLYAISELGPRCKVTYEEVVVPASKEYVIEAQPEHIKKVAKIVCN